MNLKRTAAMAVTVLGLVLGACGGGSGGGGGGIGGTGTGGGGGGGIGGTGTMRIGLTDSPACGYDQVNITIERVRVHQSADAGENDAGWSEIVLSPARRVDLLSLQNGIIEDLGELPLEAGRYQQMRLVLADNGHTMPPPNSVIPTGQSETALDTPSGSQSGIKINLDTEVKDGQTLDVVLDFDACKSVVQAGHSGHYKLKPVIEAIVVLGQAGQGVTGYVDPAIALPTTLISVQADGVPVKATAPDANGKFVLYPVPPGNYDLVVSAEGRVTAVMTGVPVDTVAYTTVSTSAVRIVPHAAPAGARAVLGTVSPETATVRALQSFSGGPTVEVQFAAVDALSGAFAFALPIDAPEKTAYVASPGSISFSADAAAAGLYTIEAASDGDVQTEDIDVSLPVSPLTFTFP